MNEVVDVLYSTCRELGVSLEEFHVKQLLEYMELIKDWNKKVNLTRITDDREMMVKHFADSLAIVGIETLPHEGKGIDVGTGAGFPGIPLKIYYPGIQMTLLDSLKKRIDFLSEVIRRLGLKDVELVHGRAEDVAKEKAHRQVYDFCFSRAVAPLNVLCEYCLPFVKIGGTMMAMKGRNVADELKESKKAMELLGGKLLKVVEYKLPPDIVHCVVIIKKVKPTPDKYPRKAGIPVKSPLK
ncbi:16S rRNA (guanine(527)-N(7))-methyltransferase RsmG [Caldanaerobius polysaccharolyticus]|uniref:16S rRNA (guanine(527)-N(7))-methyltransferase RsmG n=1 Tax=Caldanaerobius polysaccharolyticus TaxID=44256 RepID=UPI00047E1532|nr:16S rRNA (guanine(527)-N(7))-methyltransferase RsmG [Caldanaerobius polysaccharolyticus]